MPDIPCSIDLLLIQLYELNQQPEEAFQLVQKVAEALTPEHRDEMIILYQQILRQHPKRLELYRPLSRLIEDPSKRTHLLLMGVYHAIAQADTKTAHSFLKEAEKETEISFVDRLLAFELIDQPSLRLELNHLARSYAEKKLFHQALQVYKKLFELEASVEICEKIIALYEVLDKSSSQTAWYHRWLRLLLEKND